MKWTKEQQDVIDFRNRDILVSAAAGSGKTAVLVARIIQRILDPQNPVDIDRLLVVTFTKAAAAEMRERIGAAIEAECEKDPQNTHLRRQSALIHNAMITTIDSFCLFVVRNHFEEISLDPNFRIADEGEIRLLQLRQIRFQCLCICLRSIRLITQLQCMCHLCAHVTQQKPGMFRNVLKHLCLHQFLCMFHLIRFGEFFHPRLRPRTAQRHPVNLCHHLPHPVVVSFSGIGIDQ